MTTDTLPRAQLATALHEALLKIRTGWRQAISQDDIASSWVQRFIEREIEERARTRTAVYWDAQFPGLTAEQRAERRIGRMLTRATAAGVIAAASASAAELLSLASEGTALIAALPLGIVSVGCELLYTTALQVDLAFDLASIYGVPFAKDDIGEISTLLAMALGVEMKGEPTRHDKPAQQGELKAWRAVRQMQRTDFADDVGRRLLGQSVLRNVVPVAGVIVSAVWNQIVLRRFAHQVHAAARQRHAIVDACKRVQLTDVAVARTILDGAFLIATTDGPLEHHEALAISTLIDSLPLPTRIAVTEASFADDEEEWFERVRALDTRGGEMLVEVLGIVGGADGDLALSEQRFLRRVGRSLGIEIDLGKLERAAARLRDGSRDEAEVAQPATAAT